jgi:hypothetical protein
MLHDSSALQQRNFAMPSQTSSNGAGTANGGLNTEAGMFNSIKKISFVHNHGMPPLHGVYSY